MINEGHIVANHTFRHIDMTKLTELDDYKKEFEDLEMLYWETTGKNLPCYYRPPEGKFSEHTLKQSAHLGYKTIFWSLAYMDWDDKNQPTKREAFDKLLPRIHPGAVVLLHNTSKTNAEILDELLTKWKDDGYSFGSIDELFSY